MATSIIGGNYIRKSGGGGGGENPQPSFTGHVDVEGLKSLGWDDEDIEGFQTYGVFWNEEDDELYKVQSNDSRYLRSDNTATSINNNNKVLIAIPKLQNLTSISLSLGSNLVYIGKQNKLTDLEINYNPYIRDISYLDFSNLVSIDLSGCANIQLPIDINIPKATRFNISDCPKIKEISLSAPLLRNPILSDSITKITFKAIGTSSLSAKCRDFKNLEGLHISTPNNITNISSICQNCISLKKITGINSSSITDLNAAFSSCTSLDNVEIDLQSVTNFSTLFSHCISLKNLKIKNLKSNLDLGSSFRLTKESVIYIINNAAPTTSITITLYAKLYDLYKDGPEVISALEAQPLISLGAVG